MKKQKKTTDKDIQPVDPRIVELTRLAEQSDELGRKFYNQFKTCSVVFAVFLLLVGYFEFSNSESKPGFFFNSETIHLLAIAGIILGIGFYLTYIKLPKLGNINTADSDERNQVYKCAQTALSCYFFGGILLILYLAINRVNFINHSMIGAVAPLTDKLLRSTLKLLNPDILENELNVKNIKINHARSLKITRILGLVSPVLCLLIAAFYERIIETFPILEADHSYGFYNVIYLVAAWILTCLAFILSIICVNSLKNFTFRFKTDITESKIETPLNLFYTVVFASFGSGVFIILNLFSSGEMNLLPLICVINFLLVIVVSGNITASIPFDYLTDISLPLPQEHKMNSEKSKKEESEEIILKQEEVQIFSMDLLVGPNRKILTGRKKAREKALMRLKTKPSKFHMNQN
jgi:hypothetical protein